MSARRCLPSRLTYRTQAERTRQPRRWELVPSTLLAGDLSPGAEGSIANTVKVDPQTRGVMTAVAMGLGVLLVSFTAWWALSAYAKIAFDTTGRVASVPFELLAWPIWVSPGIASLIVAWRTPRMKVFLGMLMAPCGAMIVTAMSSGGQSGDFPGIKGTVVLFEIYFVMNAAICAVGTVAGILLAKRGAKDARRNVTS